jgi:hypothetical protein
VIEEHRIVPPHKFWEGPNPVLEGIQGDKPLVRCNDEEREAHPLTKWYDGLEGMLPAHTHRGYGSEFTWSTPAGVWKLTCDRSHDLGYPQAVVSGPGGSWQLADINLGHVRSVLLVLGAIEAS